MISRSQTLPQELSRCSHQCCWDWKPTNRGGDSEDMDEDILQTLLLILTWDLMVMLAQSILITDWCRPSPRHVK